ncbi:MAG: A/G-specific adenine glycosylase, partial [Pseudomonadota bacterium]
MWTDSDITAMRKALLDWYDREGRTLPWRVRLEDRAKGVIPDPYAIWLSEIMLQQTTVPHGTPYWFKFLSIYPTVADLAAAPLDDVLTHWAGLGYYARARNLHKCANVIVEEHGGEFPSTYKELLKLPGIGDYTASTIAAICFDEATTIVDGNVERVITRLHELDSPLPKAKPEIKKLASVLSDAVRPGDYGQAVMDLGATICTPRSPSCLLCPWQDWCQASAHGTQANYPKKTPKKKMPIRYGRAYVYYNDKSVWLRRRPEDGLLGGMMEVPGTDWGSNPVETAPEGESWTRLIAPIGSRHFHHTAQKAVFRT